MQIPGIDQHAYDSVQSHHKNWAYGVGGVSSRLDDQFPLRNTHSCLGLHRELSYSFTYHPL